MREIGKEQRDVSLDGKMIALVWHKLVKKMGFQKELQAHSYKDLKHKRTARVAD